MAKRMHKVVLSHNAGGVVRVRRYRTEEQARRSYVRQPLSAFQRVELVSLGSVIESRGYAGVARAAIEHPSYAL